MLAYLVRRLAIGILTLLCISFIVYGIVRLMPGTPLTADPAMLDPSMQMTPEYRARMEKYYGLDKPWYQQYFVWLGNIVRLDFGTSISQNNQPVFKLIMQKAPATLLLSVTSLILTYLLSIPIGLWSTVHPGTLRERTVSSLLYMLYSLPAFVAALFLQLLLAVKLEWLPLFGMTSDNFDSLSLWGKPWDVFKHAFMPIVCFTYGALAYDSRFIRANMLEVIRQDYIRTARAKGVPPWRIIWHHAFRNTLIPFVTLLGLTLPHLLSGAVILEQIFTWPGMGRFFFESIGRRDYDAIMGLVLIFSVLTLLGQLLADILYAVVDPRVTYS
jgi:peptide/nickel transport system permease protein